MQRAAGEHAVVRPGLVEILERQPPEEVAFRRRGIDPEHVVAGARERRRQLAPAAADLEQPRRRPCFRERRQVLAGELLERGQQSLAVVATPSLTHSAAIATGQRHHWIGAPTKASRPW